MEVEVVAGSFRVQRNSQVTSFHLQWVRRSAVNTFSHVVVGVRWGHETAQLPPLHVNQPSISISAVQMWMFGFVQCEKLNVSDSLRFC